MKDHFGPYSNSLFVIENIRIGRFQHGRIEAGAAVPMEEMPSLWPRAEGSSLTGWDGPSDVSSLHPWQAVGPQDDQNLTFLAAETFVSDCQHPVLIYDPDVVFYLFS